MAYIGNSPSSQNFTSGTEYFSGNGSTVTFTLLRRVASVNDIMVVVENVVQYPGSAYTVIGNTITFTSAPFTGTNNIYVRYMSTTTQTITVSDNVINPVSVSDKLNASTGYFDLPSGTTAQRPASPVNGMIRFNTTIGGLEVFNAQQWILHTPIFNIDYLVIAGGGGGSGGPGGSGGGAGGMLVVSNSSIMGSIGSVYSILIGSGGSGGASYGAATNGSNSSFYNTVAIGGGGGPKTWDRPFANGVSGGSGSGGSGYDGNSQGIATTSGGYGTTGQGNNGGVGRGIGGNSGAGGGGGGAGAVGGDSTTTSAGSGGAGLSNSFSGSAVTYAGGGAGTGYNVSDGIVGSGGGGSPGAPGGTNSGGGGGAGSSAKVGAGGGSGLVIIRYLAPQRASGGTITTSSGYVIHTFTVSGTITF